MDDNDYPNLAPEYIYGQTPPDNPPPMPIAVTVVLVPREIAASAAATWVDYFVRYGDHKALTMAKDLMRSLGLPPVRDEEPAEMLRRIEASKQ